MASNPIQKKVRNGALLGSLITLLITGVIITILFLQLMKVKKEQQQYEASFVSVYTLGQDVKSGQIITEDMFIKSIAQEDYIPSNATATISTFTNYSLTDNEGNRVYTDEVGTYLSKTSEYLEIYKEENQNKYYTYGSDGRKTEVTGVNSRDIKTDEFCSSNEMYIVRRTEGKTRLYQEISTGKYYILRVKYNTNSGQEPKREKEYVEIIGTPLIAKIDLNKNTVMTLDMVSLGSVVTADVRKKEYNAIILPMDLTTGDYVDIRVQLPSGQDYIVLSKKYVEIPVVDGMDSETTIWMNLSEDEILSMSCAIVESYRINGSKLYAIKYTDPGMQEAAIPTYPISAETRDLIFADPNVTEIAEQKLRQRYTEAMLNIRENYINSELRKPENSASNVPGKINESITKTQEERRKYLQSLSSGSAIF